MRRSIFVLAGACVLVGGCRCGKDEAPAAASATQAAPAATRSEEAAPAPLTLDEVSGRCRNRSPSATFPALYFYPEQGELFVPTSKRAALRLPVSLRRGSAGVEFSYVWAEDEDAPPSTATGAVTRRGDEDVKFQLETVQSSLCQPEPFEDFHRALPELGIEPGTYRNEGKDDELVVPESGQTLLSTEGGRSTPAYYRVRNRSADGVIELYVSSSAPVATRPMAWVEWTLTAIDDRLVVDYMGRFTRTYERVADAPPPSD